MNKQSKQNMKDDALFDLVDLANSMIVDKCTVIKENAYLLDISDIEMLVDELSIYPNIAGELSRCSTIKSFIKVASRIFNKSEMKELTNQHKWYLKKYAKKG